MFSSLAFCLLLNLVVSALLSGLIWTLQLVHYPALARPGLTEGLAYQQAHEKRIAYLLIPLMLAEATLSLWLLSFKFSFEPQSWLQWGAAACVGLLGLITAIGFIFRPTRLKKEGYEPSKIRQLLVWNWARTLLWTLKLLLVLALTALYV